MQQRGGGAQKKNDGVGGEGRDWTRPPGGRDMSAREAGEWGRKGRERRDKKTTSHPLSPPGLTLRRGRPPTPNPSHSTAHTHLKRRDLDSNQGNVFTSTGASRRRRERIFPPQSQKPAAFNRSATTTACVCVCVCVSGGGRVGRRGRGALLFVDPRAHRARSAPRPLALSPPPTRLQHTQARPARRKHRARGRGLGRCGCARV